MSKPLKPMNLQLFAEGQGGNNDGNQNQDSPNQPTEKAGAATGEKLFTQAEVSAMMAQRVAREKSTNQGLSAEQVSQMIAEAVSGQQTKQHSPMQASPTNEQKDEAVQEAQRLMNQAREMRLQTSIEALAIKEGVSAEALPLLVKYVDTSDIKVDGVNVDEEELKAKLTDALEKFPMLKGTRGSYSSGANPGGQQKVDEGGLGAMLGRKKAESNKKAGEAFNSLLGF